ncbi:transcription termination factor 2 isoform X2 [Poeciliopsis prolifica]|uniref:transcription termination factor 2 isoform X2 n=1 Tax=Poeciliopsis prolifica TaxID=188132 RepID=UPI0024132620|nr:transcription termination factor 2 isoform X2 [Poeciliopsis prolifica]
MERVKCDLHGSVCMLKTGVKEGPNKGKSFYICVDKQGCNFTQQASVPPSHCLHHEESVVELQALSYSQQQQSHRLYYRCAVGKREGQRWCGNVPWTAQEKERRTPLTDSQLQPSCLPRVRNPFKAPDKTDKTSERKGMLSGGCEEKEGEKKTQKASYNAEERQHSQKENMEALATGVEVREERKVSAPETYRGKLLPAGMKVKKRISSEESSKSKADGVDRTAAGTQDKAGKSSGEEGESGKTSPVCPDAHKNIPQEATNSQTPSSSQNEPTAEKSVAKSVPGRSSQSSRGGNCTVSADIATETHQEEQDDDVVLVSVKPAARQTPPALSAVQKTITSFPGFQSAAPVGDPKGTHCLLSAQLQQKKATLSSVNVEALPDKGERLRLQVKELEDALESLSLAAASQPEPVEESRSSAQPVANPFSRPGGTVLLPSAPVPGLVRHQASGSSTGIQLSQGNAQTFGDLQMHPYYGGRMTNDRLLAVKNATCEAIDHLHKSLESCPDPEDEASDPRGIKVPLLAHQRRALAWLLWREAQNPCGGILADDMGLGKTLTMIALMLTKKMEAKKEEKKLDSWISKSDSSIVSSKGTLVICPASLIHHWKKEIERHVKTGRMSVYLYHGSSRERSARALADYDVVVTTYSLVSKEIPVKKEDADNPGKDSDHVPSCSGPLLRVTWARVILDEAHNIKNPKVQTSMAVCQLRARARWAVTGTPIQNNLLDMYSLLKFLRCSPFDEYKLWKAQVDNGSSRGRERLNILTRTLLLRRTKDQLDSRGKPLVSLPKRTCEVHQLKLSEDEQAVYDVVFAQSRSTLQNYLKRHEEKDLDKGNASSVNPFDKVAQEFGVSQADPARSGSRQASSTVHILSLLLRLRQCCCHLSLLKKTLDSSELQGDGIVLSLEEQLNALSLSSTPSPSAPDPKDTVALNGTHFPSQLFEETSESTKISAITSELMAIKEKSDNQKSVIVSQWTSMLNIIAVHLRRMGLTYGVIDGTVNPKRRMDLVEEFNTNPRGPQVMLVSLCAGGVGLNLIGGNHLFLIDMHWNPALEDQACDRIYRVGQRKDVTIHRFVCEGTVEDKIATLQTKKKELAENVLSGTGSTVAKLSLADLKIIFGV